MVFLFSFLSVTCGIILVDTSGSVSLASDGMVTIAMFNCSDGYTLVGDATLRCNTDGNWNNAFPICGKHLA